MKFDSQLLQRLVLAFTTALFLSCAARVSAGPAPSAPVTITR